MIGAADWLNHAIPLEEELRGGINRLISGGLLVRDDHGFHLTIEGQSLFDGVQRRSGLWGQLERLSKTFALLVDPATPTWVPARGEVARAVDVYRERR